MEFLEKFDQNPYQDLYWNIPEEQKIGQVLVMGGNAQNFRVPAKISEFLVTNYPLKEVKTALPDALKSKLPPLDNLIFLKSTSVGSFADGEELSTTINVADFGLLIGDFSKNSITEKAVASAVRNSAKPLILTRDTVDLVASLETERILMQENLIIMGSIPQWQKILKTVFYPKMLMMSQSLVQVAETLHKFTLSYPVQIITLHEGQVLIAKNGQVAAIPLEKTNYSPLTFWNGELAANILAMNLYNPDKFIEATVSAIFR